MKAFEKNIRRVEPYVPGEQPQRKVIKLNTNENPYPPAPGVKKVLEQMDADRLRLYPDPEASVLVAALAEHYGVGKDQVFVGVGSDDVLSMCFLTFFNSEKPVLFPDITYSFYKVWAELYRIPYECQKLDENFRIVREDYYKENGGVIFPNPNAPTGIYEGLGFVEDIIAHNQDVVVIVDEAYIDFAGKSALELLERYENLIVVQTFSKARSMAYTMNQTSLACGVEAVKDQAYFERTVKQIVDTRAWAVKQFEELGFTCLDSGANFVFVTHPAYDAGELFEELKKDGIYVRYWGSGRIRQYLRITIGTREEMEALFAFFRNKFID